MKLIEIAAAADTLASQLDSGMDLVEVLRGMPRMQPAHAELWEAAAKGVMNGGKPLSSFLVDVWPPTMVAALKAGEEGGTLVEVLQQIEQTAEAQLGIMGFAWKLLYPAMMILGGFVGFLIFMVFVIPKTKPSGTKGKTNLVYQLSKTMESLVMDHGLLILAALVGAILLLVSWARSEAGRATLTALALELPLVSTAVSTLSFGLWAKYLALATGSGIPTIQALAATAPVLPGVLRESVEVFAQDLSARNKTMTAAADLGKLPPDDLRVAWWPVLLANAWIQADKAGGLPTHLAKASPKLLKAGEKAFMRLISVLNLGALVLAAFLILTPVAAFYMSIFSK